MSGGPDGRARIRSWARRALRGLPIAFLGLAALGLLVRLTVRDRVPVVSVFYYALPAVVQAALVIVAGASWGLRRKWRLAAPCAIGAAALLAWWHHGVFYANAATPAAGPRIVFWNIARGAMGVDAIVARIRREDPDVIAFAEAARVDNTGFWARQFPGYCVSNCHGGLIVIARGTISGEQYKRFDNARCLTVRIETAGLTFRLAVADVMSNPLQSRGVPLGQLYEFSTAWPDAPLVVVGDFNTPADSVFFDSWREKMNHGFEQAGQGCFASWPIPLPVIAIDQVWVGRALKCGYCRLISTWLSDHRMVEFNLVPAQ
ncbi:MAG: endonuclease/exonuclease/phosphatase family protein [Candidatus Sumerlaeia bacterium]